MWYTCICTGVLVELSPVHGHSLVVLPLPPPSSPPWPNSLGQRSLVLCSFHPDPHFWADPRRFWGTLPPHRSWFHPVQSEPPVSWNSWRSLQVPLVGTWLSAFAGSAVQCSPTICLVKDNTLSHCLHKWNTCTSACYHRGTYSMGDHNGNTRLRFLCLCWVHAHSCELKSNFSRIDKCYLSRGNMVIHLKEEEQIQYMITCYAIS